MEEVLTRVSDLSGEVSRIASLALTLETAMVEGSGCSDSYGGAAHILANLLFEHVRKLEAVGRIGKVEGVANVSI